SPAAISLALAVSSASVLSYSSLCQLWIRRQTIQFGDSLCDRFSHQTDLLRRIVCRAKRIGNLLLAQSSNEAADPPRIIDRDAFEQVASFHRVVQAHLSVFYFVNKMRLGVSLRVVAVRLEL